MQLARPGVGYGVMESRVESGRIDLHPIKRARTTFTYLAVAMAGTDTQKAAFRRAVNRAHAQVYSTPDSPVQYNAFDLDLQLWVAACLYKGGVDFYRMFIGEMDDGDADRHYREARGARLHVAGAAGDVAGGPGRVRPLLERAAREGPHRRRRPQLSVSHCGGSDSGAAFTGAWSAASRKKSALLLDGRLPAAALPRRDATSRGMPPRSGASTG